MSGAQEQKAPLIERLGIDPTSDAARWIKQQQEAGVKDRDILMSLSEAGSVAPARFRRVVLDEEPADEGGDE